jgi:hypothetical protein
VSAATKLTGSAFWAFLAGEDRQQRINNMREARMARAIGYTGTVKVCVGHARDWNRYLIRHMRYARGEV